MIPPLSTPFKPFEDFIRRIAGCDLPEGILAHGFSEGKTQRPKFWVAKDASISINFQVCQHSILMAEIDKSRPRLSRYVVLA